MGSVGEQTYSVPQEAEKLFETGILNNPLISKLPAEIKDAAQHIHFTGNRLPSIPINWRFAESAAVMKAFEASMLNVLRSKKYGVPMAECDIDTDHASLFVMTPFINKVVVNGAKEEVLSAFQTKELAKYGFRSWDLHRVAADLHRMLATNIYRTRDGRWYHTHGKYLSQTRIK